MNVKFNNGVELPCITVNGKQGYYQNANREIYEFHFDPNNTDFAQLESLFGNEENTKQIRIIDGDSDFLHENFTIRMSLSFLPIEVLPETTSSPAKYENRFVVSMAQKTYMENLVSQLITQQ
ncbi:hypothetical protein [Paenibacillus sanguinis]|uniref:hypothetical protein n=1 Tax=Paenibacillus sanguinis TaxID=225906 RepID=UPI0003662B53|nr:hypothetical protein [Paenibacillus sanguinis]